MDLDEVVLGHLDLELSGFDRGIYIELAVPIELHLSLAQVRQVLLERRIGRNPFRFFAGLDPGHP